MTYYPNTELTHFGVKGMKWGIRKEETGNYRIQDGGTKIDSDLPQSTKVAVKEIASMFGSRYNFHISEVKSFGPGHPEYESGSLAYVDRDPSSTKREGIIHASTNDIREVLKKNEETGFFAKDCGNLKAMFTHETAHAIFHSQQQTKTGLLSTKVVGGDIKARDKALKAAIKEARREGIPVQFLSSKVSGYAMTSGSREELEAELFSQYHWGSNSPRFVKVWGETLHQELGVDKTPFREVR